MRVEFSPAAFLLTMRCAGKLRFRARRFPPQMPLPKGPRVRFERRQMPPRIPHTWSPHPRGPRGSPPRTCHVLPGGRPRRLVPPHVQRGHLRRVAGMRAVRRHLRRSQSRWLIVHHTPPKLSWISGTVGGLRDHAAADAGVIYQPLGARSSIEGVVLWFGIPQPRRSVRLSSRHRVIVIVRVQKIGIVGVLRQAVRRVEDVVP